MNIPKFILSLSEDEKNELRDYFLEKEIDYCNDITKTKIEDFIGKNESIMSTRLKNNLLSIISDSSNYIGPKRRYMEDINKSIFSKIRNAGKISWKELQNIYKNE